jgi:hypothetical protein
MAIVGGVMWAFSALDSAAGVFTGAPLQAASGMAVSCLPVIAAAAKAGGTPTFKAIGLAHLVLVVPLATAVGCYVGATDVHVLEHVTAGEKTRIVSWGAMDEAVHRKFYVDHRAENLLPPAWHFRAGKATKSEIAHSVASWGLPGAIVPSTFASQLFHKGREGTRPADQTGFRVNVDGQTRTYTIE